MKAEWVNNEGLDFGVFTPTKWISYAFTIGLVLVTLVYMALYAINGMTSLVVCSCLCLGLFAISFHYIAKGPDIRYMFINFAEIIFFMVVNVHFLGTGCGFQLYCFGFVASSMLVSLTAGNEGKILTQTWVFVAASVMYFLAATLWFVSHEPPYAFGNPLVSQVIFVLNALSTMGTIVMFTGVYMTTAINLEQRLAEVATHDELTHLTNRRGFYPVIDKAYEANAGQAGHGYFAMLDIDHFKNVNDLHGHECGDAALQRIAEVLLEYSQHCPQLVASRWGGEEFLLMYAASFAAADETGRAKGGSGAGLEEIAALFENLRADIARTPIPVGENVLYCTVTIGVADFTEGATADDAINRADARLYEGKQAGRNRVVLS